MDYLSWDITLFCLEILLILITITAKSGKSHGGVIFAVFIILSFIFCNFGACYCIFERQK